ncbi:MULTISPECIES: quinone oxidoreductase [unclassified Corynebacterium]|uniref:quinone oxidoreductase family protein n=1 Tax=unclassified Corynebacterium TaxID=2624378 RepID=UPI00264CD159|nr:MULTISPECIES: quinone oxidoreductase [unclassified Corynebacterium]MDN8593935.1 quinone oxidoreductase [Corynebacterium sp. P4_F2]WKK56035.1 quinone oxidoreductase [Corynebacterium sp. P4-C1]
MKAIQITAHGGPEALSLADVPTPTPSSNQVAGQDQVLVRVSYAGVNYIDTYYREGIYHSELPFIPGLEGCGEVVEDPAGNIAPGTVVAWDSTPGSYAEYVCVDRNRLVAVPDTIPANVAATMLLQGITAHYLLYGVRDTQQGDTILLTAGAGGVGLLLTQLAAAQGATVYSVVSTDEKEQLAYDAGATEVFRYSDDLAEMVRRRNGGRGVDVVYDGVGRDTFNESLEAVRPRGLVCLFGAASGPVDPIDPQLLNTHGSIFLTRPSIGAYTATDDEFRMRAQAVVRAIDDGTLNIRVQEPYALADAAQAHADLQSRKTTGSIVLRVHGERD